MSARSLLIVGALTLGSLGIASAKSYDITLTAPAKAGNIELKPGDYKVKVEGSQAVFTDTGNSKTFTAPVKVGQAGKKFDATTVESSKVGDMDNIQAIELGGSSTKLEFGQ
jgi:hypothetical protein